MLLPPQDGPADIAALAQGEPAGGRRRWVHGSSMGRAARVGAALGVGCRLAHGTSARASLVLAAVQRCAPLRACAVLRVCARPHVSSNMCSIIGHISRHGIGQGSRGPLPDAVSWMERFVVSTGWDQARPTHRRWVARIRQAVQQAALAASHLRGPVTTMTAQVDHLPSSVRL